MLRPAESTGQSIDQPLAILDQLYGIYDQFLNTVDIVCEKYCADCCTCNVTLTTLEARKIISALDNNAMQVMMKKLMKQIEKQRFSPKITTNQLADICMSGEDPPEEPIDPSWGQCPLLQDDKCPIYDVRPFACRCMISKHRCADTGTAEIDEFTITVSNVFLQYIEHIDQNGFSGNMTDVLPHIISKDVPGINTNSETTQACLIKNSPLRTLMIPPEHREKIEPIMNALRAIKT